MIGGVGIFRFFGFSAFGLCVEHDGVSGGCGECVFSPHYSILLL